MFSMLRNTRFGESSPTEARMLCARGAMATRVLDRPWPREMDSSVAPASSAGGRGPVSATGVSSTEARMEPAAAANGSEISWYLYPFAVVLDMADDLKVIAAPLSL